LQAQSSPTANLQEVVITSVRVRDPLLVIADAKAPRQPMPAHDGADYLKTVPGFSVIRKGGADGDPVFRGMAASRVAVQVDGEQILGGCGMRMDPPTAYVFPEAYDRIVVIKGPQTVLHGAGASAATVLFERDPPIFTEATSRFRSSAMLGSFGRRDLVGDLSFGNERITADLQATHAEADDFRDGDGRSIHGAYRRWSGNLALGWAVDERTRLEVTGARSDGEAAYADRSMDGVLFDRENLGIKFERRELSPLVESIRLQAFYNYVDHVMDNYSLREFTPTMMMPSMTVSNPDRKTTGIQLRAQLRPTELASVTLGLDQQGNRHTLRSSMNQAMKSYGTQARVEDARFEVQSAYAEFQLGQDQSRWLGGARVDRWQARDLRATIASGMGSMGTMMINPTAGLERETDLVSGFLRREQALGDGSIRAYAGFGYVERFPDYWETVGSNKESATTLSAFETRPERTGQWDAGLIFRNGKLTGSVSAFASSIDDFILVQSGVRKGMRTTTVVRNIDARTWGGELDASYEWNSRWSTSAALAYTRGDNRSDDLPLAQIPPLEARFMLDYRGASWSAGALWRVVSAQDRYVIGQGNIVGQDLGRSAGFSVFSAHATWDVNSALGVSLGIDNLTDETYAEHLSRAGAALAGYEQTVRVNEPGRTMWMKLTWKTIE
jgi:iron complex outermembrane receptor protein